MGNITLPNLLTLFHPWVTLTFLVIPHIMHFSSIKLELWRTSLKDKVDDYDNDNCVHNNLTHNDYENDKWDHDDLTHHYLTCHDYYYDNDKCDHDDLPHLDPTHNEY